MKRSLITEDYGLYKAELAKMEKVRRFLLDENIVDDEGFIEFVNTI